MQVDERQLLREAHRRLVEPPRGTIRDRSRLGEYLETLFPMQRTLVECWDEDTAVLGTRRAGKSKFLPGKLLRAGEKWPGTVAYYLHPDGGQRAVETLLGPDINIGAIIEDYGLPWKINLNSRSLRHNQSGTEIRMRGADDVREARKYRGDKVSLVVTEETQNFPAAILKALRDDILGPALADVGGQWLSIGTVGEVCAGPWYDITRNEDEESRAQRRRGVTVFDWSVLDNPHMTKQAARVIAKRLLPFTDKTEAHLVELLGTPEGRKAVEAIAAADPSTLREWFGRWVNDSSALFYSFDARRNLYDGTLPRGHVWFYILGGDLGTTDAYAHHVWAVSRTHPVIYEVESFAASGLHAGQWRQKYDEARRFWNPVRCWLDEGGLGRGVADEWRDVYGIPVEPAQKRDKYAAVSTLNAELREGCVKLLAGPTRTEVRGDAKVERPAGATASTMAALRKDPKSPAGKPPQEDPSQPNHASDAALYGHRAAMVFLGRADNPEPEAPKPGTPEYDAAREEKWERELEERIERRRRYDEEDDEW